MISVLIATHDRSRLLARTLEALTTQDPPAEGAEIIVVDNGSTDDTPEVVEAAARQARIPVFYLSEPRPGKSAALNSALLVARGDPLLFTDDDVQPEAGWLTTYADTFRTTTASFAIGRILPLWEAPPPDWLSTELYGVLAISDNGPARQEIAAGLNDHMMALGTNMAVRREVFERIGCWRTDLGKLRGTLRTGEDGELFLRMLRSGLRGLYLPEARVRHWVPAARLQRSYFRRWFIDNGAIAAQLEGEYPSTSVRWLGVPRYRWREAAVRLLGLLRASMHGDRRGRFAHTVWLLWILSYTRFCWLGRRRSDTDDGAKLAAAGV